MTLLERLKDANRAITKIIPASRDALHVKVFTIVVRELITPFLDCDNEIMKKQAKLTLKLIGPSKIFKLYLEPYNFRMVLRDLNKVIEQEIPKEENIENIERIIQLGMDWETEKRIRNNAREVAKKITK